jgi:5'-3' exonuclease
MKTIVILDGNNVAYGIYSKFKQSRTGLLTSQAGIPTTVTFGMLRSLKHFADNHKVDRAVVAWDTGGGSKWRKTIFPHYKANRKGNYDDMEDYFAELDSARDYLAAMGINQAPCSGIEADDIIGWLAKKYQNEGWKVIIYSNDEDYYQLINKTIRVWRPITNVLVDKRTAFDKKKVAPKNMYLLDGLVGQPKDNIPGACDLDKDGVMIKYGFGPAKGIALLHHPSNEHRTLTGVKQLLDDPDSCPVGEKFRTQLLKNWSQVVTSARISRIRAFDRQYGKDELVKLMEVYEHSQANEPIIARSISNIASMLDINNVDPVFVAKQIGVNVQGKPRKKKYKKKRRVKV